MPSYVFYIEDSTRSFNSKIVYVGTIHSFNVQDGTVGRLLPFIGRLETNSTHRFYSFLQTVNTPPPLSKQEVV